MYTSAARSATGYLCQFILAVGSEKMCKFTLLEREREREKKKKKVRFSIV